MCGMFQRSDNDGIPPSKYANAELMKIPNFLHLTPNHVKKHCEALKRKFLLGFIKPCPKIAVSSSN